MSAGLFNQTRPYKMNMEDFSHKNNNIRRTFSAVMSSPKWVQNNGFNIKKVKSSHQLQALGEEENRHDNNKNDHDHNKGPAFEDIWSSIQANKKSWGDILSNNGSGQLPAPYVHPLVKRSASSLSEKSLEICTESLGSETGSETGSDGFSDKEHEQEVEEEKEKEKEKEQQEVVEVKGSSSYISISNASEVSYNSYRGPTSKRSMMVPPGRHSFPPPLPSLANRDGGSNLHIRSHRQDGRLVVEAVSVPCQNCFRAQRQDGRLLLTLSHEQDDEGEDDEKGMIKDYDQEIEEGFGVGEEEELVINVQRSCPTLTMTSKFINKSTWPRNYNRNIIKTLDDDDDDEGQDLTIKEEAELTLLPQPRVSTATAVLNAYEYYWRRQTNSPTATAVAILNPLAGQHNNNNNKILTDAPQVGKDTKRNNKELLFAAHNTKGVPLTKQELVIVKDAGRRGGATSTEEKGEYLVPFLLRGCKDHKKSFFLFDPYCIATT